MTSTYDGDIHRTLYAFMHGEPLGVFTETGSSRAGLSYETSYYLR